MVKIPFRTSDYSQRIFRRILMVGLVPNLLVLLLTVAYTGNAVYRRDVLEYRKSLLDGTGRNFENALQEYEEKLQEIDRYLSLLWDSRGYPHPFSGDLSLNLQEDWRIVIDVHTFLNRVVEENPGIESLSFYSLKNSFGISSRQGFLDPEDEALPAEAETGEAVHWGWSVDGEGKTAFGMHRFYRSLSRGTVDGYYRLTPSPDHLRRLLYGPAEPDSLMAVTDWEGRIITVSSSRSPKSPAPGLRIGQRLDPEQSAARTGLAYIRAPRGRGRTLYLFYPKTGRLNRYLLPMGLLFLAANLLVLCGVILAKRLSRQLYSPINRIWTILQTASPGEEVHLDTPDLQTILAAVEQLKENHSQGVRMNRSLEQRIRAVYPAARRNVLNRLLRSSPPPPEILSLAQTAGLEEGRLYRVILVHAFHPPGEAERELILRALTDRLPGIAMADWLEGPEKLCAALQSPSRPEEDAAALTEIFASLKSQFPLPLRIIAGTGRKGPEGVCRDFASCRTALDRRFSAGPGVEILPEGPLPGAAEINWEMHSNRAISALRRRDRRGFHQAMDAIGEKMEGFRGDDSMARFWCRLLLTRIITEIGQNEEEHFETVRALETSVIEFTDRFRYFEEFKEWIIQRGEPCFLPEKGPSYSIHIHRTMARIRSDYDKDIGLEQIADGLSLSVPYLSKLFKKEAGESFKTYLTKFRLHKAKTDLKDLTLSVKAIALRCGYRDTNHFIRIFKKYEGVTPGEYRNIFVVKV